MGCAAEKVSLPRLSLVQGGKDQKAPESDGLPAWESFALGDRQILVSLIVQTALRRVQAQPRSRPWQERG